MRLRQEVVEWRELHGQIVVLDLENSDYLTINRSGAAIWPLLAEGADREQLIERLASSFRIAREQAERDVDAFVDSLSARGLLEEG